MAVVGAGLAGLGAASRLARHGCQVCVLERSQCAGGRFSGHSVAGFNIERSLPLLHGTEPGLLDWLRELDVAAEFLPLRRLRLAQLHKGSVRRLGGSSSGSALRTPGLGWRDLLRTLRLPRLLRRYAPLLDPQRPERAARWDDRSLADFGRLYFGQRGLERWIGPAAAAATPADLHQLSRVAFLLRCTTGQWPDGALGPLPLALARRPMYEVVQRLASRLEIRFGAEVEGVDRSRSGELVLRLRERDDAVAAAGGSEAMEIDAVILATAAGESARIASSILTTPEREFLGRVRYLPTVTLSLALEAPIAASPLFVRVPEVDGLPFTSWLFDDGDDSGRAPPGAGLVTLTATRRFALAHRSSTPEVVEKELLTRFESAMPAVGPALRFSRLERVEAAVPNFAVGAYRALARFHRVQADRCGLGRRLYFAGDHLVGPGAQDALWSGLRAAGDLLADFERSGRSAP